MKGLGLGLAHTLLRGGEYVKLSTEISSPGRIKQTTLVLQIYKLYIHNFDMNPPEDTHSASCFFQALRNFGGGGTALCEKEVCMQKKKHLLPLILTDLLLSL